MVKSQNPAKPVSRSNSKSDQLVAFTGLVELVKWTISSSQGQKITLGLESRDDLDAFDKATRRRRNHAGQEYRIYFSSDEDGSLIRELDCWLWGASWSHTAGASIAIYVSEDDILFFQSHIARDQSTGDTGQRWIATMVELDDQGDAVNQVKASKVVEVTEALKGGPVSRNAAMLLWDPKFHQYLARKTGARVESFADADSIVKRLLGIGSKKLLDHDDTARKLYEAMRSDFHHSIDPF